MRGFSVVDAARCLLAGGAQILQLRHKGHWPRSVFQDAECIRALCREAHAQFVVNDRADMAMLLDAGLHVGQEDLPPREARRLMGPGAMLGYSTHNAEQLAAAAAEPVDYLAIGPIFPTGSKQNPDAAVGLEALARYRKLTGRPLVAIGGIRRDTARAVLDAGADSTAVIGDMLPQPCTAESLRERISEWQQLTRK